MNFFKWDFCDKNAEVSEPKFKKFNPLDFKVDRKIIQIATGSDGVLIALCSDGSLWDYRNKNWSQMKGLPNE